MSAAVGEDTAILAVGYAPKTRRRRLRSILLALMAQYTLVSTGIGLTVVGILRYVVTPQIVAKFEAIEAALKRLPSPECTGSDIGDAANFLVENEIAFWRDQMRRVLAPPRGREKTESAAARRSSINWASADRPNASSSTSHTSIDLTEAAASRNRGKKRSTISAADTRSTCAPMLMAATMTPS